MRSFFIFLLSLLGFFTASAQAQTWTQPIQLSYTSMQVLSGNTCMASNTISNFDGFYGPGPDVIYQLRNRQPVGSPHYSSAVLTLIPSAYYPSMDFEIFACQLKYGNAAENCALEADNVIRPGQSFQLAIPNQYVTYRIIVTAGNDPESGYVPCVPYTLVVQRLQ